jgi:hypothetical protein
MLSDNSENVVANFKLVELSNEEIAELLAIEKTQSFRGRTYEFF